MCVSVIGIILLECGLKVAVDVLALDKQQRQSVDKADDVGPAAIQVTPHPQLAHAQEVIVRRLVEVEDSHAFPYPFALVVAKGDLYAVTDKDVFLAVGGDEGLRGHAGGELANGISVGGLGQTRIQGSQPLA